MDLREVSVRSEFVYLEGVVSLTYSSEKCTGCTLCTQVCPRGVFEMDGGKTRIRERDRCMECGACMNNCPSGALRVEPGVGCAYAVIRGKILGTPPDYGCGDDSSCCG